MSWDINRVVLVGRLSNDIELKYTPSGAAVARFGIAVGGRPSKDGQDTVSFFTVVVWNKAAETANQYLSKGSRIAIDGRLEQSSWTSQDGTRKSKVEIIADRIEFLQSKPSDGSNSNNNNNNGNGGGYNNNKKTDSNSNQNNNKKSDYTPSSSQTKDEEYYDNTDFNDAPLDKYDPFDEDVPF